MKRATVNILLVLSLVAIFAVSFVVGGRYTDSEERFAGTDAAATAAIKANHPDFEPWFEPFFSPQSGEVEAGLFALQAALGGTVLGFAIGALYGRRRKDGEPVAESASEPTATASS